MRIVHWAKYYPPEWGGVERVTADLAVGAAGHGAHSVVIAFDRRPGAPPVDERMAGVRVLRAPLLANPANQPISLRWIWQCIRQSWQADAIIIHAPNLLAAVPLLVIMLARLVGLVPGHRVLLWHSDIIGKGLAGVVLRPVEHFIACCCTVIVATSPPYAATSRVLDRHRQKVRIIPIGVDPPEALQAAPSLPADLEARIGDRALILSIGRLVSYKGFDTLVRAVARLKGEAVSVIVGHGPEMATLRQLAEDQGVDDRVILAGVLSPQAVDALYRRAQIYAMTSNERSEAFGVVLLEAMSHGLPVIACDIAGSGVPWVVQHGGNAIIVPLDDPAAFAAALDSLLADRELATSMGLKGRRRYQDCFTRPRMVASFMQLFR